MTEIEDQIRSGISNIVSRLPEEYRANAVEVLELASGKPYSVETKPGDGFIYRANWKLHNGQWLGIVELIKYQSRTLVEENMTKFPNHN